MRRSALGVTLGGIAVLVAAASGAAATGRTTFVVQPDPRLCPSPLCGGYWVAAANRARTRCHDGLRRPRCYVAEAVSGAGSVPVPPGSLVRGSIAAKDFGGLGELGVLDAGAVFAPVGRAAPSGAFYRLRDLGVRCVRAPCFSTLAARVNGTARTTVSALDVGTVPPKELPRVEAAVRARSGVLAQGRIVAVESGGRAFRATRFFLASDG